MYAEIAFDSQVSRVCRNLHIDFMTPGSASMWQRVTTRFQIATSHRGLDIYLGSRSQNLTAATQIATSSPARGRGGVDSYLHIIVVDAHNRCGFRGHGASQTAWF